MSNAGNTAFVGNIMASNGAMSNNIPSQGNVSTMQHNFSLAHFTNEQMEKLMYLINNTHLHNNISSSNGTSTALGNHAMGFQHASNNMKGTSLNPPSRL